MNQLTTETFDQNARDALNDPQLRNALRNLTRTFADRRQAIVTSVDNWEDWRESARGIKEETLAHLDKYLEAFSDNAERAGAKIHLGHDGVQGCAFVIRLLHERNATKVVKS